MNWKVGDVALIVNPDTGNVDGEGEIMSVDNPSIPAGLDCLWLEYGNPCYSPDGLWSVKFAWLRPLPPPNEVTSWEGCIFKPKELVT